MNRLQTGIYRTFEVAGEPVRAFVPHGLPPRDPPLVMDDGLVRLHARAMESIGRLRVASAMVPSASWFLYGFVRKEAVITSEIEGTEATLQDVVTFEATQQSASIDDVREVCNYVDALAYVRAELAKPDGLPLSVRLLNEAHRRLMRGVRGEGKQPGEIRRSQNWVGGSRPGTARFVPPPAAEVAGLLGDLEQWLHSADPLPPLVKAGLAHVQFETIHPYLDGNGRIGRLLIALLMEHWDVMSEPILYVSVAIRRRQQEYYARLSAVRTEGAWEAWTKFFLECVIDAAEDGVRTSGTVFALLAQDRVRVLAHSATTVPGLRLLDALPAAPVVTLAMVVAKLGVSKPTAIKAIDGLMQSGVLKEVTGRQRDRAWAYQRYLDALAGDSVTATK
jgi:Fic family protein